MSDEPDTPSSNSSKKIGNFNQSLFSSTRLNELDTHFRELGFNEWSIVKGKQGPIAIRVKNATGHAVHAFQRRDGSFAEYLIVESMALTPEQRRMKVRRLREQGLSQSEISKRLGVSQKTVSNDLQT